MAPVLTAFDADALGFSILGLDAEMRASGDLGNCELFVDSIERYVSRIAEPWRRDGRLAAVWSEVQSALDHPWTLAELAAIAGVSEEHLRRICQSSLGRSPMKQLLMLRMEQAAHLLTISDHTVEAVGRAVGYENPFAFSNMFKRIMGRRAPGRQVEAADPGGVAAGSWALGAYRRPSDPGPGRRRIMWIADIPPWTSSMAKAFPFASTGCLRGGCPCSRRLQCGPCTCRRRIARDPPDGNCCRTHPARRKRHAIVT